MRQQIDLAWLRLDVHLEWFKPALMQIEPALTRINLHELPWMSEYEGGLTSDGAFNSKPESIHVLARSVVELRRYDALLLTVSLPTLAWTRQCLAALPRRPVVPVLGVLNGLRSGAMIDLLELGLADFVRLPVCDQEFRARLISAISRAPKHVPLREPRSFDLQTASDGRQLERPQPVSSPISTQPQLVQTIKISDLAWPTVPFQENKQRVIDLFERQYVRSALQRARGNISAAARLSGKDRRSFWDLMRRHGITATPLR
jgi:hypothetical protein